MAQPSHDGGQPRFLNEPAAGVVPNAMQVDVGTHWHARWPSTTTYSASRSWPSATRAEYVGKIVAYPGATIRMAWLRHPDGGPILELLQYVDPAGTPVDTAPAEPGHRSRGA